MRAKHRRGFRRAEDQKQTFMSFLEERRIISAKNAWEKAQTASRLRHQANKRDHRTARIFSAIKVASVRRVLELAPELIRIVMADDVQGLVSVRCNDGSKLHLPANPAIAMKLAI
jgi:hypothetical protein